MLAVVLDLRGFRLSELGAGNLARHASLGKDVLCILSGSVCRGRKQCVKGQSGVVAE